MHSFDAGTAEHFGLIISIFFLSVILFTWQTLELPESGSFLLSHIHYLLFKYLWGGTTYTKLSRLSLRLPVTDRVGVFLTLVKLQAMVNLKSLSPGRGKHTALKWA